MRDTGGTTWLSTETAFKSALHSFVALAPLALVGLTAQLLRCACCRCIRGAASKYARLAEALHDLIMETSSSSATYPICMILIRQLRAISICQGSATICGTCSDAVLIWHQVECWLRCSAAVICPADPTTVLPQLNEESTGMALQPYISDTREIHARVATADFAGRLFRFLSVACWGRSQLRFQIVKHQQGNLSLAFGQASQGCSGSGSRALCQVRTIATQGNQAGTWTAGQLKVFRSLLDS